jgi:hypothetical protein
MGFFQLLNSTDFSFTELCDWHRVAGIFRIQEAQQSMCYSMNNNRKLLNGGTASE